jgi:outer membrane lipoprotein-sorting protein
MKKLSFAIVLTCFTGFALFSQTTPQAEDLVKSFSEKMQSYQSIKADFKFTLENLQEGFSDTHKGNLVFKEKKYFLDLMEMEVYFDGSTKWQFIPKANEVTISGPSKVEGGFLEDPTQIFRNYEKDFKSKLIADRVEKGVGIYEIELLPLNLNATYKSIKVVLKKQNLNPVSIKYFGKDGVNYIIDVNNFKTNIPIKDDQFVFNPSKHKGIVIVDMR